MSCSYFSPLFINIFQDPRYAGEEGNRGPFHVYWGYNDHDVRYSQRWPREIPEVDFRADRVFDDCYTEHNMYKPEDTRSETNSLSQAENRGRSICREKKAIGKYFFIIQYSHYAI